jgi:hypothetical protein
MSSLYARGNAIIPVTGVDLSAAQGKAVKFAAGVVAVNDSAVVPAIGIVLEGNVAAGRSSIGILGGLQAPVLVKIAADSAALKLGDTIQQKNDGTFTKDAGAGNARCVLGVITSLDGAVAGDLAEAQLFAPQIRA